MEDSWMKQIGSRTVCDFYYILFWLRLVSAVLILVGLFFIKNIPLTLYAVAIFALTLTDTLFTFLICERAIAPQQ
jgi:hypothetical protein